MELTIVYLRNRGYVSLLLLFDAKEEVEVTTAIPILVQIIQEKCLVIILIVQVGK